MTRVRLIGRGGLLALLATVALGAFGCETLDKYQLGRCGNGVLEPLSGEDCDTFQPPGTVCIPPGAPNQCRYRCTQPDEEDAPAGDGGAGGGAGGEAGGEADGEDDELCPQGWSCGIDDVCRAVAGTFGKPQPHDVVAGRWLSVADFDGDGYDDVVWQYSDSVEVDYFDNGQLASRVTLGVEALDDTVGTVADGDGDKQPDIAIPSLDGLAVFRGVKGTRALLPTTFASLNLDISKVRFQPIDLIPNFVLLAGGLTPFPGDDGMLLRADGGLSSLGDVSIVGSLSGDFTLLQDVVAGELDTYVDSIIAAPSSTTPEEFVTAYESDSFVTVYRPRLAAQGATVSVDVNVVAPTQVDLPSGVVVEKILGIQSFNPVVSNGLSGIACGGSFAPGDDHMDLLLIGSSQGGASRDVYIAYGLGDGHFHSKPCELPDIPATVTADDSAALYPGFSNCDEPLGLADLDQDGQPDVVTKTAIHLSSLAPAGNICGGLQITQADGASWSEVVIDDFTGDGQLDMIAASAVATIDFYEGGGGKLSLDALSSTIDADHLTVGDFDGDGVNDLALTDRSDPAQKTERLLLMFGVAGGPPDKPIDVGTLPTVVTIAKSTFRPEGLFADDADDLLVFVETAAGGAAAILRGRPDRNVQSPFLQAYGFGTPLIYAPLVFTFGSFFEANQPSAAMIGSATPNVNPSNAMVSLGAAKSTDNAQLQLEGSGANPTLPLGMVGPYAAHSTDVNGDGLDDMLVTYGQAAAEPSLSVSIPSFDPSTASWSPTPPLVLPNAMTLATSGVSSWSTRLPVLQALCHLGDPQAEVVEGATFARGFMAEQPCAGNTESVAVSRVALFGPSVLKKLRASQPTAVSEATFIDLPQNELLLGLTCADINGDKREELLLLTLTGATLQCDPQQTDYEVILYGVDFVSEEPPALDPLGRWNQNQLPSLALPFATTTPPVSSLAAGDFNGDRITDLVFGARNTTMTVLGQVAKPQ